MSVRVAETGEVTMHINGLTPQYVKYIGFTTHGRRIVQYLPKHNEAGYEHPRSYKTIITIEEVKPELRECPNFAEQSRNAEKIATHAMRYEANLDLFKPLVEEAHRTKQTELLTEIRDILKTKKRTKK